MLTKKDAWINPKPDFIWNDDFVKHWSEFILPMEGFDELLWMAKTRSWEIPSLCEMPLLSREQEQYLFRQFNALKYAAGKTRYEAAFNRYMARSKDVKDVLHLCNMRLVVNFVKAQKLPSPEDFMLRVSDATMILINCIDKFDYGRGFKFSTYAVWAFRKTFLRLREVLAKESRMMPFSPDMIPDQGYEVDLDEGVVCEEQKALLAELTEGMEPRTLDFIRRSLGTNGPKETLEEIGRSWGITKERVRQVKMKGLKELRQRAEAC